MLLPFVSRRISQQRSSPSICSLLNFDHLLQPEEIHIKNTVEKYVTEHLLPAFNGHNSDATLHKCFLRECGEIGLLGCQLSQFGGVSSVASGLLCNSVEKVDSAFRSTFSVQSSLVMFCIDTYGSEDQKQKYLQDLASGKLIGCFALTEETAGSDPSTIQTKIIRLDAERFVLNGSKSWITNAPMADIFIVWAKDEKQNVVACILQNNTENIKVSKINDKISLKHSITGCISFEGVVLESTTNILPKAKGLKSAFECLNNARLGIAFGSLGAAERCLRNAIEYSQQRVSFGAPLAAKQLVQRKFADAVTEIYLGMNSCINFARRKDRFGVESTYPIVSLLKRNSCVKSLQIIRDCRDVYGAYGITESNEVMRHMLNMEAVNTYEGTADIHALILGRHVTGCDAF